MIKQITIKEVKINEPIFTKNITFLKIYPEFQNYKTKVGNVVWDGQTYDYRRHWDSGGIAVLSKNGNMMYVMERINGEYVIERINDIQLSFVLDGVERIENLSSKRLLAAVKNDYFIHIYRMESNSFQLLKNNEFIQKTRTGKIVRRIWEEWSDNISFAERVEKGDVNIYVN